jgi:hypothetical protein
MIDATKWISAAEGALGWPQHSFLAAYLANRVTSRTVTLDASPIVEPLRKLLDADGRWEGTATELLAALEARVAEKATKRKDWPATANVLGTDLRRLAPDLRNVDSIEIIFPTRHDRGGRRLSLARAGKTSSGSSEPSATDNADNDLQSRTNGADEPVAWPLDRSPAGLGRRFDEMQAAAWAEFDDEASS